VRNRNLGAARKAKNDEFYTQLPDIERELKHYKNHFKNKVIYCNCDSEQSNFVRYFKENWEALGIKKLLHTGYDKETGAGDFRGRESLELLQEADIVVTNPPFSLFREYIDCLMEHDKKFLVIGSMNALTYKEVFKYFKDNRLWLGINNVKEFTTPQGETKKIGNITWFTNLFRKKRNEELFLFKKYNKKDYPTYDNYNAIEVSKVADIPVDYFETMGVPITFLSKYNPEQFEITGTQRWFYDESLGITNGKTLLKGKETYDRIFIKRRET